MNGKSDGCLSKGLAEWCFFCAALTLAGEASDDVMRELSERLDKLEQENRTFKTEIKRLNEKVDGVEGETKDLRAMSGAPAADIHPVSHKTPLALEMYGYIKTDLIYYDS